MDKVIDKDTLKSNLKYIVVLIVLGVCLIAADLFSSKPKTEMKELNDEDISYHELVINEIMSSNSGSYIDDTGNTYDWLEIYNGTEEDISLNDYMFIVFLLNYF